MTEFNLHNDQRKLDEEPKFNKFIDSVMDRRTFLIGASTTAAVAFFAAKPLTEAISSIVGQSDLLGFTPIPPSISDEVIVPEGYIAEPLISWGDPLFPHSPIFSQLNNAQDQALQYGDNTDGMTFFPLSNTRAVLVANNEYTNNEYLYPHQGKNITADDVKKAQAAHGVSIIELKKESGKWVVNVNGVLNRRVTAYTPTLMTGPATGHSLLKTAFDSDGINILGTFNNCANGQTPWGTYLTCEENFNGYFASSALIDFTENEARYGLKEKDWDYDWWKFDKRFDLAQTRNEPNRFGWVVEIDPMDPYGAPKKRSALGRFKHENAALVINQDNHVVVYMGDDERGEHIYKFVSKNKYQEGVHASNRDLLEDGTLYVAQFHGVEGEQKGHGEWIELTFGKNGLTPENGFNSQAEVVIYARQAATIVGATTMDRPEWVAVHPKNNHVFCTLTNNKYRGVRDTQPLNVANPRESNPYGHIIRWEPKNGDHNQRIFNWDLFLIAGNPVVQEGPMAGSENITKENMFNSPDGLGFDLDGRLWIMTDGKYSNKEIFEGMGNNQMLCADPQTGEVKRFMTGPIACEITGLTFSPDYKTMFVGIQHPGEGLAPSHFPEGGSAIPRSTVMRITKNDGGVIGA